MLDATTFARLSRHAERTYPEEACALLMGPHVDGPTRRVLRALPLPNSSAADRSHRFEIPARTLRALDEEPSDGENGIVGVFHSHPDGTSDHSEIDRENALPSYEYLILEVDHGTARTWGAFELEPERRTFHRLSVSVHGIMPTANPSHGPREDR